MEHWLPHSEFPSRQAHSRGTRGLVGEAAAGPLKSTLGDSGQRLSALNNF